MLVVEAVFRYSKRAPAAVPAIDKYTLDMLTMSFSVLLGLMLG
jgi:hypothetical protein